jgi:hypothetical protein
VQRTKHSILLADKEKSFNNSHHVPTANAINFLIITITASESARMFVPCKPFQPYLQRLGFVEKTCKGQNV